VVAASGTQRFTLLPVMFEAPQQGIMRHPDIVSKFTSDFYLSPISLEPAQPEVLMVEASVKPFISVVWGGTVIMLVGFVLAIIKRMRETV
jgi:cytochrome c biogenesis factor